MKKLFIVEFPDAKKSAIRVAGKGRHSVAMKVSGMRATKAIAEGKIKAITEIKSQ